MEISLKESRILIQNGISKKIRTILGNGRFFIVTNPTVNRLFSLDVGAEKIIVPDSENSKSLKTAEAVYDELIRRGATRDSTIIAFGGGVIGDLAGFVAATYMRGISLVHVPTTLLAQVDSSIGGKTGINHRGAKNIIGAFYQPKLVLTDPEFLAKLPEREFVSGMAEVIKYGLIKDRELFGLLESNARKILERDKKLLEDVIFRCCRIKADIVSEDEKEAGKRMILNFGHTAGHAIESASGYKLKHGEAVSLGMIAAASISPIHGEEKERIRNLLGKAGLPTKTKIMPAEIAKFLRLDKKARLDASGNEKNRLVLLRFIGSSFITEVGEKDISDALKAIE